MGRRFRRRREKGTIRLLLKMWSDVNAAALAVDEEEDEDEHVKGAGNALYLASMEGHEAVV